MLGYRRDSLVFALVQLFSRSDRSARTASDHGRGLFSSDCELLCRKWRICAFSARTQARALDNGRMHLMFQAYVDTMLLATLSLFAIALVPTSPIRPGLNYAAGVLGAGCFITSFWLLWGARLPTGNWLRWIYERPSMASFRMARPSHYIKLLAIRFLIVLGAGFALYGQFVSFHIEVPLVQTLALMPFVAAIGNSPISPGGIGTTQLVFTLAFARFASKDDLFALSLAVTAFNLLVRIPMGIAMGAPLVEEALEVKNEFAAK